MERTAFRRRQSERRRSRIVDWRGLEFFKVIHQISQVPLILRHIEHEVTLIRLPRSMKSKRAHMDVLYRPRADDPKFSALLRGAKVISPKQLVALLK